MGKYKNTDQIGIRSKENNRIIAVYPGKLEGSDEEIEKKVKDWYYQQSCGAEEDLLHAIVDKLSDDEIRLK